MSNSTIVSICNFSIGPEFKPGLFPNDYIIPAATEDKLGIVVIGDAWTDIPLLDRKTIRVPILSGELARSIVEDWKIAQLRIGPNAQPGVFYVDGAYSEDTILDNCQEQLNIARVQHTGWANRLVQMADDLWQMKPIHSQISSTMINAARYLKIEDRVWMKSAKPEDTVRCPSCTSIVPAAAVVCGICHVVLNAEEYKSLTFAKR